MSSFEQIIGDLQYESSMESLDVAVRFIHETNALGNSARTHWLARQTLDGEHAKHPNFYSRIMVGIINGESWTLKKFQRHIGDEAFHYKTTAEQYAYTDGKLAKASVELIRKFGRYSVHKTPYTDTSPSELYGYLNRNWPVDAESALRSYYGRDVSVTDQRETESNDHLAAQSGAFIMRLGERRHIKESPVFKWSHDTRSASCDE